MNTLREAAQQALEYLDAPSAKLWPAGTQYRIITALRAALAQQPVTPASRTVKYRCRDCGHEQWVHHVIAEGGREYVGSGANWCDACQDGLPQIVRRAEPVEPVAADAAYQRWLADTHAPALRRMDSQGAFAAGWQAARAVERAHGIGGQE